MPTTRPQNVMKFVVYQDANCRWYWELNQLDGEPVARSAMGFTERSLAVRNAMSMKACASHSLVFDRLGNIIASSDCPK